jgi:nitrile hydratase accessory protein
MKLQDADAYHFAEPWQAELFAVTVQLSRTGLFTWPEWVDRFTLEASREPVVAGELEGYYRSWLTTLEALLAERAELRGEEIDLVQEHWRRSYLATPHGQPVCFNRNAPEIDMANVHHHHSNHEHMEIAPVAIHLALT